MRLRHIVILTTAFLPAIRSLAFAHSGATGIVKQRMELMKSIADQMKSVGKMIKGDEPFASDQVVVAAGVIADHAEKVPEMFPEGSLGEPSEAVPAIWDDWETFVQMSNDLGTQAVNLAAAARDATDVSSIRPAFAAVGKTCSACHEDFRIKK